MIIPSIEYTQYRRRGELPKNLIETRTCKTYVGAQWAIDYLLLCGASKSNGNMWPDIKRVFAVHNCIREY
eukprot:5763017-Karenia_brevis.AAC.1